MKYTKQQEKKPPVIQVVALMAIGLAVVLALTVTPWNILPVQITEDVSVVGIIEQGCVGESEYGVSVVVPNCNVQIGEIVSATFFVPAMNQNGYYDKIENKLAMVEP